jgi:hypothetical protein
MDPVTGVVVGALLGVGGTTIAAVATFLSGSVNMRAQVEADQRMWLREERRKAYVEFVDATAAHHHAWWLLGNKLVDRTDVVDDSKAERSELYYGMFDLMHRVQAAVTAVRLTASEGIPGKAATLVEKLGSMDSEGSFWFKQSMGSLRAGAKYQAAFWKAHEECYKLTDEFVTAVRAEFTGSGKRKRWRRRRNTASGIVVSKQVQPNLGSLDA